MPRVKCHLYKLSNLLFRALGTPGTNELLPIAASRKCALHLPMRDSSVLCLCKLSPLSDKSEELLQSWLNHCLYGSKHHSAHKRNNFSWTLTTVEFSPSSFPESKKETTQKISLVAERAVKDSGNRAPSHRWKSCVIPPSGAPLASGAHAVSPRTISLAMFGWLVISLSFCSTHLILYTPVRWKKST